MFHLHGYLDNLSRSWRRPGILVKSLLPTLIGALGLMLLFSPHAWGEGEFDQYLSDLKREQYELVEYNDLLQAPKKFYRKQLKIKMPFRENASQIPYLYGQVMPQSRYYYFSPPTSQGVYGYYNSRDVPIIVSRKSKSKLIDYLLTLDKGTQVVLFGQLRKVSRRYSNRYGDHYSPYYLYIDDFGLNANFSKAAREDATEEDYEQVEAKNLDLLANRYLEKRIKTRFTYLGRRAGVEYSLRGKYPDDAYFQLESGQYSPPSGSKTRPLKAFNLIGGKNNMELVNALLEIKNGDEIDLYGILQKHVNTHYQPEKVSYYILLDKIREAQGKTDVGEAGQVKPPPHGEENEQFASFAKPADPRSKLLADITSLLVQGDYKAAMKTLRDSPDKNGVPDVERILKQLIRSDHTVLATFKAQIGETIQLETAEGPRSVTIKGIRGPMIEIEQDLGNAVIKSDVDVRELPEPEKLRRMDAMSSEAKAIFAGVYALRNRQYKLAEKCFSHSGPFAKDLSRELAAASGNGGE